MKRKKIGIFLGHPAHFHLFRYISKNLIKDGNEVTFLVKRKDILESLVKESGIPYIIVRKKERQSSAKLNLIWSMICMDFQMLKYILKEKPDIIIGTYCPIFTRFLKTPFIVCNEDDADVVPRFAKLAYPPAAAILTPKSCNCGKWDNKAIKYNGFQKLAYLHPNQFKPDINITKKYISDLSRPYVLMRFAKLNAHHDGGIVGINNEIAENIIKMLEPSYQVFVSSERELPNKMEKYRLKIDPKDIHHIMNYASIYIGDSQSMAVESAIIGVPNVRYNTFAGKIGVLNELEKKYHLTIGVHATEEDKLYKTINSIISNPNNKSEHTKNKEQFLKEKIDVTAFFTWFIENYPQSKNIMKENPDFQNKFK